MASENLAVFSLINFMKNARPEDSQSLLSSLLTPAEIDVLAQRLEILDRLANGTPQREISETLGVGIATVTRGSRVWQKEKQLLRSYFPRARKLT
ncbi:transcriptional regulator [bacterium]|nr:transcriptional regulator [bacterium]